MLIFSRCLDRFRESSVRFFVREKNGSKEKKIIKFKKRFLQPLISNSPNFNVQFYFQVY